MTRETSAHTAVRAPAARPPSPPDRPRWGSRARAARRPPWGSSPGGSRPADSVPDSRPARSLGAIVGHCSRSTPTVIPSGPGAPLFATTFFIAESSRSTTSSILAGVLVLHGDDRLRHPRSACPGPVPDGLTSGPRRVFCCRDRQPELPPPFARPGPPSLAHHRRAGRALPRRPVLRGPPTSAGPSAAVSAGLPAPGAQQISQGKSLRFRGDPVANTPAAPTGIGLRCHEPAHPANGRLTALHSRSKPPRTYGFFQTRPHGSPPAPNRSASRPPGQFRAAPLPHRCWVPPVRAPGQDFHLRSQQHAWHTRRRLAVPVLSAALDSPGRFADGLVRWAGDLPTRGRPVQPARATHCYAGCRSIATSRRGGAGSASRSSAGSRTLACQNSSPITRPVVPVPLYQTRAGLLYAHAVLLPAFQTQPGDVCRTVVVAVHRHPGYSASQR